MQVIIPTPPVQTLQVGFFSVHIYAICMLTGFAVAFGLAWWRLRHIKPIEGVENATKALTFEHLCNILICTLGFGIIGARAYYVITVPAKYIADPLSIFAINQGGLGIMGGIIGATLAVTAYCKITHINLNDVAYCIIPGVPFAQAIGRLGNWFNGELYGTPTDLPWGLDISRGNYVPTEFYHPTFLYELLWNLLVGTALLLIFRLYRTQLRSNLLIVPTYLILYLIGRIGVESLRIDYSEYFLGLRINMWCAILLLVASIVWWALCYRFNFRRK